MAQTVLPFQYEVEERDGGMTALAGLPAYMEFAQAMWLGRTISRDVQARHGDQGWTDEQMAMSQVARRAGETSSYRKRLESGGSTNVLCSRRLGPIFQVPQLR